MIDFQVNLNNSNWSTVERINSSEFLVDMLLHWIILLEEPLISDKIIHRMDEENIVIDNDFILKNVSIEAFETINVMLSLFRKIPSISSSTLDFALERFSIYISSHRKSLLFFKSTSNIVDTPMKKLYQHGDKVVENLKSKVSGSINAEIKGIPSSYLATIPTLPQLPTLTTMKLKFGYANQLAVPKEKAATVKNSNVKENIISLETPVETNDFLATDNITNLLKIIYKSFRVSSDNRAVIADSKKFAFVAESCKSPTELVLELHQNSTANLALLLKPNTRSFSASLSNKLGNVTDVFNNYVTNPIRDSIAKDQMSFSKVSSDSSTMNHIRSISAPIYFQDSRLSLSTTPRDSVIFDDFLASNHIS
jgi:hypothetical protein